MGLLESLFGTLKCLLCCQQQDPPKPCRPQHPQYGAIPYRISVQPPAKPQPRACNTQRHEAPRSTSYRQQSQYKTERQQDFPGPYRQHQLRREPRPYRISYVPPDGLRSHTQQVEAHTPAPYQHQQPQCETEQQEDSPGPYQQRQLRREPRPYRISYVPPTGPQPHTQQEVRLPTPYQQQQPQYEIEQHQYSPESYQQHLLVREPRPYRISYVPPDGLRSHTQQVEVHPSASYQQPPQNETEQPEYSPEPYEQRQQESRPHFISDVPQAGLQPHTQQEAPAPYQQSSQDETPFILVQRSAKIQRPLHTQQLDQDQVLDQQNDSWSSLRERAKEEGKARTRSVQESHRAHVNGDHAQAKELSDEGKRHRAEMKRLNKEASEAIFNENNKDRGPGEVDLHGLYVEEAIAITTQLIQEARIRGDPRISLIVGKGRHSGPAGARIKPAIEGLVRKWKLDAKVDPSNTGVLIVSLDGQAHGAGCVGRSRGLRGVQSR